MLVLKDVIPIALHILQGGGLSSSQYLLLLSRIMKGIISNIYEGIPTYLPTYLLTYFNMRNNHNFLTLGIYLTSVMAITCVSVVMTVIVLNFFYRGPTLTEVPPWIQL